MLLINYFPRLYQSTVKLRIGAVVEIFDKLEWGLSRKVEFMHKHGQFLVDMISHARERIA